MKLEKLKDKRIVFFVAETFPAYSGGGLMAFRFAKHLSIHAKSVCIICFNYNNKLIKDEEVEGVRIIRISYFNYNLLTKVLSFPWLVFNYLCYSGLSEISFIYGSYMPGFELIILSNWLRKIKTIFVSTLLSEDDIKTLINQYSYGFRTFRKFVFSKISIYYAINGAFKRIWESYFGDKIPVLLATQGVDHELFQPETKQGQKEVKKRFNLPLDLPIIISAGFLIERKGYRHIFESFANLDIPFLYVIAGAYAYDPYHRSSVQEQLEMQQLVEFGKQKLGNKLVLLGAQKDMRAVYLAADIVLHGASFEGTPNIVLEAMSCQKLIIMKQLEGLDFVFKENSNVVLYTTPQELLHKIEMLLADNSLRERLAENARKTIVQNHGYSTILNQFLELYEIA